MEISLYCFKYHLVALIENWTLKLQNYMKKVFVYSYFCLFLFLYESNVNEENINSLN